LISQLTNSLLYHGKLGGNVAVLNDYPGNECWELVDHFDPLTRMFHIKAASFLAVPVIGLGTPLSDRPPSCIASAYGASPLC
jgi:hypothetical protein